MTERQRPRRPTWWPVAALALLSVLAASPLRAQDAARPTGGGVLARLDAARQALAQRAKAQPDPALAGVLRQLGQMGDALRAQLGGALAQPLAIVDDSAKAAAQRVDAAAARTQAYLKASNGCRGGDARAMAAALALAVAQWAATPASGKPAQAVIDAVETTDGQPLFVLHPDSRPLAFVLLGANLLDPQCANPQLSLIDAQGRPADVQPVVTGITPQRIALKLASTASLPPGGYVLRVVPLRKAFLRGCTKQPAAVAALQVALPMHVVVDYTLTAACRGQGQIALGKGNLPAIAKQGVAVSQPIDVAACTAPESYTISATAHYGDGDTATAGPLTQPADADITAGLPGGLSLSWNPAIHTLFARTVANACRGSD